jgi:hypothetical protein
VKQQQQLLSTGCHGAMTASTPSPSINAAIGGGTVTEATSFTVSSAAAEQLLAGARESCCLSCAASKLPVAGGGGILACCGQGQELRRMLNSCCAHLHGSLRAVCTRGVQLSSCLLHIIAHCWQSRWVVQACRGSPHIALLRAAAHACKTWQGDADLRDVTARV